MKIGTFYGISIGTGDPELITLKGLRLLQQASVVAFPQGKNHQEGIAESIIKIYLLANQEKLPLFFPYVTDVSTLMKAWEEAAVKVWEYLKMGKDVAFACEGDVSFYSTFTYLAHTLHKLQPNLKIERIPGVSSPMVAASALGLPLTIQHQKLVVLPAIYTIKELEEVLNWAEVIVLLKVSSVYAQVWKVLQKNNLFMSAWIVEKASFSEQVIYKNLQDFPTLNLSYFSVLIIHNYSKISNY